jgi:LytS/YehU family sensor histidine kinase
MAKLPVRPKWQTTVSFLLGAAILMFEVGLNAMTGREVNTSIIGAAVGIMLGGPVLNKSASRKERNDNDDSDAD